MTQQTMEFKEARQRLETHITDLWREASTLEAEDYNGDEVLPDLILKRTAKIRALTDAINDNAMLIKRMSA